MTALRIVIVEDRDVVRIGLQTTIREMSGCTLVGIPDGCGTQPLSANDGPHPDLDDTLPGSIPEGFVRRLNMNIQHSKSLFLAAPNRRQNLWVDRC
jgi:hypothetical protein